MKLDVFALPELAPQIGYDLFICIDVLRATTTITTALAAGAERLLPFATVEETFKAREELLQRHSILNGKILLGGERKGLKINGFDLGNSPDLYIPETVTGKTILFTTTNGTKTILHGQEGSVILAAFINVGTVLKKIFDSSYEKIAILCAGTEGCYTEEDLLLAGLLTDELNAHYNCQKNLQAENVLELWQTFLLECLETTGREINPVILQKKLEESHGGKNLIRIGLKKDIAFAAQRDSCSVLPVYQNGEVILG